MGEPSVVAIQGVELFGGVSNWPLAQAMKRVEKSLELRECGGLLDVVEMSPLWMHVCVVVWFDAVVWWCGCGVWCVVVVGSTRHHKLHPPSRRPFQGFPLHTRCHLP